MNVGRLGRWLSRVGAERIAFLLALLSIVPMLRYLPTEANTARLVRERFESASRMARAEAPEVGVQALAVFLAEHPASPHEADARLLLAETLLARAAERPEESGEGQKQAADQARKARELGAPADRAYALRVRAARELVGRGSLHRALEILEELRVEGSITPHELLELAGLYVRQTPRKVQPALDRLEEYLARTTASGVDQVTGLLTRAEVLSQAGRWEEAAATLDGTLRDHPEDPRGPGVRLMLARTLYRAGRFDAVRERLTPLAEAGAPEAARVQARYWTARADLEEGRVQEAIEGFRGILQASPEPALRAAAGVLLASAFRGLRELRSAYAYLEDAEPDLGALDFDRPHLIEFDELLEEVRLLTELSETRELAAFSLRLTRALAARVPVARSGPLHGMHAASAERLARLLREQAEAQAGSLRPEEVRALRERAGALGVEAAEAHWARSELHEPSPQPGRPAFHAGVNWHEAGQYLNSVRALRRFLADCLYDDPMQARALRLLGVAYQRLGDLDKALDAHRRNLWQFPDAFPDGYASRREMGACYEMLRDWKAAELAYLDVLNGQELSYTHPVWRESLARLGETYYRTFLRARAANDEVAAEVALRRGIERLDEYRRRYPGEDQDLIPVLRTLGVLLLHAREYGRAAEALERAVNVGQGVGQTAEAFRLAEAYEPPLREAALLLADAHFLNGDIERALARYIDFRQRYARGRTELWALRQMEQCAIRRKQPREAARYRELYEHALQRLSPEERREGPAGLAFDFWATWLEKY